MVCKNIIQLSDFYHKRLLIITETYPGVKIHLAIQQYSGDKEPYMGIGKMYPPLDGNGEPMPNDMICMPMPLINNINVTTNNNEETNNNSEETSNNTSWFDEMDGDTEFELHQTLMQDQMNNRTLDSNIT